MPSAVSFDSVSKSYGAIRALDSASFRIATGETVALLGPNGAGKTTAVNILLGLRQPDGGSVTVFDGPPQHAVAAGRVGALLQSSGLPPGARVSEVLGLARSFSPHPMALDDVVAKADLAEIMDRRVEGLSGGQAQRLRYALAIAGAPDILFLDEPTVGLDVESRRAFWAEMKRESATGRTILFATHYLDEAEDVADRIVVLRAGKIVADDTPVSLKAGAGKRKVSLTQATPAVDVLARLPGVASVEVHGTRVVLQTSDSDATVVGLVESRIEFRDLEVTSADLEDAFLALTADVS